MRQMEIDSIHRPWTPADHAAMHCTVSPRTVQWIRDASPSEVTGARDRVGVVIDVGCGTGALTFAIASSVPHVIGIDLSESLVGETEARAKTQGLSNVSFKVADAEKTDYRSFSDEPVIMVVATLCMSDAIMQRAAEALGPGSPFIFACLEDEQWKESGRPSRFAYDADTLRARLQEKGFQVVDLCLEREVLEFGAEEQMTDLFFDDGFLKNRWQRDGRWETFQRYAQSGGRTLTVRSHLLANTRRI